MSTRFVFLPTSALFPTTNFPQLGIDSQFREYLGFDATTAETCYWTFKAPSNISGALSAIVTYRAASATSGTFKCGVALEAITDGDATDTDSASSFATVNTSAATTVPGTAGYIDQITVTLTNDDSIAAGDQCRMSFARDISDSASGDIQVLSVELRDSAA